MSHVSFCHAGQSPGEAYVERLPFNLHNIFNSSTVQGRANVAKATMGLVTVATLGAYLVGPSVMDTINEAKTSLQATPRHTLADSSPQAVITSPPTPLLTQAAS
ncbi:hypothetical protein Pmani_024431 [Petrolisthes manimaculis]|uniref:Uncharacterized protein n=1 Tax=Petrolisthes manimaculis TaxID=1843537 RepID=A0AAE1TYP4_9EUCA|nr:hypothetical protein Pmani_024431 [Petrolisthes manimaculis]